MNLYLQNIVEYFNQNNLPADWLGIDLRPLHGDLKDFGLQLFDIIGLMA